MRRSLASGLGVMVIGAMLALPGKGFGQPYPGGGPVGAPAGEPAGSPTGGPGPQRWQGARREAHPCMRAAAMKLMRARAFLQHAAHDYSGHRQAAVQDVNQALEQIELGVQSDTETASAGGAGNPEWLNPHGPRWNRSERPGPYAQGGGGEHFPRRPGGTEPHPEMNRALRALNAAKTALGRCDRDFHGHRAAAAQQVDAAVQQVQAGIQSDTH